MADKLKSFGELFKETMVQREGVSPSPLEQPSGDLSDAERTAILEKVAKSTEKTSAQPPSAEENINEDTSMASFGTLLQKTVELQEKLKNQESSNDEEIREAVIGKSKLSLTEDMLKRLIR